MLIMSALLDGHCAASLHGVFLNGWQFERTSGPRVGFRGRRLLACPKFADGALSLGAYGFWNGLASCLVSRSGGAAFWRSLAPHCAEVVLALVNQSFPYRYLAWRVHLGIPAPALHAMLVFPLVALKTRAR